MYLLTLVLLIGTALHQVKGQAEILPPGKQDDVAFFDELTKSASRMWHLAAFERSACELKESYDYIVVGAGTAGIPLAARLSEDPSVSVLLIEQGGSSSEITHVPKLLYARSGKKVPFIREMKSAPQEHVCQPTKKCVLKVGNVIGGGSSVNAMHWNRGGKLDFDEWGSIYGLQNWTWSTFLKYYKKIERNEGFPYGDENHGTDGPVRVGFDIWQHAWPVVERFLNAGAEMGYPRSNDPYVGRGERVGFYPLQSNTYKGVRQSADRAYLHPISGRRPNLDIIMLSRATKVLFDERRKAIGVEYVRNNLKHSVGVKREVILSAGALANPQILLLSGVGPAEHLQQLGIPVVANLPGVGENLIDHVFCFLSYNTDVEYPEQGGVNRESFDQWRFNGTGYLGQNWAATAHLLTSSSTSKLDTQHQLQMAYERAVNPATGKDNFLLLITTIITNAKSRGVVRLKSADPLDDPHVDPRYLSHKVDLDNLLESIHFVEKLAETTPLREIGTRPITLNPSQFQACQQLTPGTEEFLKCYIKHGMCQSGLHFGGSCRMGIDGDPMAVLDERLRVRGVTGVRAADVSVAPDLPRSNTMAMAMAIGEHAADLIKDDHARQSQTFGYNF